MEGEESPGGRGSGGGGGGGGHLGVNKVHSGKISKVVKRSVIQPPKPQAPVYTIDKNDFRIIVQKLTGSAAPASASASASAQPAEPPNQVPPPPPPVSAPPPPSARPPPQNLNQSRLHRARPPPLQSVQSFNKLVSNLTPMTNIPPPSRPTSSSSSAGGGGGNFAFRPTPPPAFRFPTPPGHFSAPSAAHFQLPPPSNFNLSAAFSRPPPLMAPPPLPPPPQPHSHPLLNPQPQFLSFSPLPSPTMQFQLQPFGGSQVPFSPGSIFPLSPSGQLQQLSPGSFPLSPRQFPFTSF